MKATHAVPVTKPEDILQSRAWVGRFFCSPGDLPISFVFDGNAIGGIPEGWHPVSSRRRIDANIIETVFRGHDAATAWLSRWSARSIETTQS